MEFKSQKEYEKEKARWNSVVARDRSPAGYEKFLDAERAWKDKVERDKIKAEADNKGSGTGGGKAPSSMKITGAGDGYKGDTMKINPDDLEFKGYNKVMSGKAIEDPGTKFAKRKKFKQTLDKIEGKFYDKDGNLLIPKFDMPDRVELSDEQKAANAALNSQFDDNGFYKTDKLKMPKMNNYRTSDKYKEAGNTLAKRMGIIPGKNDGVGILKAQASRYSKSASTPTLTIPDYSLGSTAGQNMLKIGKKKLKTKGMRT